MPKIADVEYLSVSKALTEFSQASGLGETLQSLAQNPLPNARIICRHAQTRTLPMPLNKAR